MSRRKRGNSGAKPSGLMGQSHALPHQYADEGDKGRWFRRKIRRRETRAWKREAEADG